MEEPGRHLLEFGKVRYATANAPYWTWRPSPKGRRGAVSEAMPKALGDLAVR
ncbi:MAG TPA: hypothetical protein VE956_23365 [Nodularia sp. (in: cyanobacteria)]|nr:hypothetical protein [Nodularia sp. (in: cyanobacteria)]